MALVSSLFSQITGHHVGITDGSKLRSSKVEWLLMAFLILILISFGLKVTRREQTYEYHDNKNPVSFCKTQ